MVEAQGVAAWSVRWLAWDALQLCQAVLRGQEPSATTLRVGDSREGTSALDAWPVPAPGSRIRTLCLECHGQRARRRSKRRSESSVSARSGSLRTWQARREPKGLSSWAQICCGRHRHGGQAPCRIDATVTPGLVLRAAAKLHHPDLNRGENAVSCGLHSGFAVRGRHAFARTC